jgi:hypothetical protein
MDELNIFLRAEDDNFEFKITDIGKIETLSIITKGNPGAVSVMLEIYKTYQEEDILLFLNKIWKQQIIGSRLWYIYKNECNRNINELLSKDLIPFTKEYFLEKFEKYL